MPMLRPRATDNPPPSANRLLLGVILLCAALALFSVVFGGCAATAGAGYTATVATSSGAPLVFEIVHQRRMAMPGLDGGSEVEGAWVTERFGRILNNRTIPVHVTIDCDLSYWTPIDVPARTQYGPGEMLFLLRPEDRTCLVSRVKKD